MLTEQFGSCRRGFIDCFVNAWIPKFNPSSFGCLQSRLGTIGYHRPFVLCHSNQDVDEKWSCVGIVHCQEVDFGLLESGDEVEVPAEAVQFCDQ